LPQLRSETLLAALALIGMAVYFGALAALFGRQWFTAFRGRRGASPPPDVALPPSE